MNFRMGVAILTVVFSSTLSARPAFTRTMAPKPQAKMRQVSFSAEWLRYPAPDVIIKTLQQDFDQADLRHISDNCQKLTDENRAILGDSEPGAGIPSITYPNQSFSNWYNGCLVEYIKAESLVASEINSDAVQAIYWDELSSEQTKLNMINGFIERYIGPDEVLIELQVQAKEGEFAKYVMNEVESFAAQPDDKFNLLLEQEGRLSMRRASMIIQFLIQLEDINRH